MCRNETSTQGQLQLLLSIAVTSGWQDKKNKRQVGKVEVASMKAGIMANAANGRQGRDTNGRMTQDTDPAVH